jgi:hypothetical protein
MITVQAKSRAWCKECETWHPRDEHVVKPESERLDRPSTLDRPYQLSAEPSERPIPLTRPAPARPGWLNFSIFLCVVLPLGIIAWSAAAYVVVWLLPNIKAAIH